MFVINYSANRKLDNIRDYNHETDDICLHSTCGVLTVPMISQCVE